MKTNPHEPIGVTFADNGGVGQCIGLTKREHFASLAMQGLIAHNASFFPDYQDTGKLAAAAALKYADALIAALNEGTNHETK
jgi:hypothetical protein